jgi:putative ABC transport system permease protein
METFLKDLKHAVRMFRENPLFTVTALAALALGIGVNTAIFSVVNAVLLKPVPFPEPDRLVFLMNTNDGNMAGPASSPAKFMHWHAQTDALEDVAAFRNISLNYGDETPERIQAGQVSEAYFRAFRAPLVLGRGFTPDEDLPRAGRTVVLSEQFWTQRLDRDPNILGKTVELSGDAYTVVGVVSRDFDMREFGEQELWVPFQLDPNTTDQGHYFQTVARLKPGVELAQAQARLETSAAAYRERFPIAMRPNNGFSVLGFQDTIVGRVESTLVVALGAVAFVLLIACANVANLLLIRATGRRREIAIRSALGAGRWRIVRQLLTESVLLSLGGGVLGLVLGFVGMRALLGVNTAGMPRLGEAGSLVGLDWRVVAFTLLLSLGTGILFGLVPALVASRSDLNTVIKDSSSRSGSGLRHNKTRSALVVVEVGLAVVLLIGAALLIRTSLALSSVDPGFQAKDVLTMRTSLSGPRFTTVAASSQVAGNTLERLRAIPGVAAATMTCCVPLQGGYGLPFNVVGRANEGPFTGGGSYTIATSGYFEAFNIPVVRGRSFTDRDTAASTPVAIINQAMVDQFWKDGGDPLTDQILIGGAANMKELATEPARQIVGIVANVRANGLANDPGPTMYVPHAQMPDALNALMMSAGPMSFVVRTSVPYATIRSTLEAAVRETTGLPVTDVQPMDEIVYLSISRQRLNMLLMTIFGGAALVLAAIGIYGLMAYSVQNRTQELGIRMALGAQRGQVKGMVVREGMLLVGIGVGIGLVAAFFLAKILASALYGVQVRDVLVFVAVPVTLAAIALGAVWIAARRASGIDPLDALRYE